MSLDCDCVCFHLSSHNSRWTCNLFFQIKTSYTACSKNTPCDAVIDCGCGRPGGGSGGESRPSRPSRVSKSKSAGSCTGPTGCKASCGNGGGSIGWNTSGWGRGSFGWNTSAGVTLSTSVGVSTAEVSCDCGAWRWWYSWYSWGSRLGGGGSGRSPDCGGMVDSLSSSGNQTIPFQYVALVQNWHFERTNKVLTNAPHILQCIPRRTSKLFEYRVPASRFLSSSFSSSLSLDEERFKLRQILSVSSSKVFWMQCSQASVLAQRFYSYSVPFSTGWGHCSPSAQKILQSLTVMEPWDQLLFCCLPQSSQK